MDGSNRGGVIQTDIDCGERCEVMRFRCEQKRVFGIWAPTSFPAIFISLFSFLLASLIDLYLYRR